MNIEDLQLISNSLPGCTEDIKWEDHLCFNVGSKMFLVTSPDHFPPSASFKVKDLDFDQLLTREGFSPNKHLGRYKWISVDDINRLSKKEWQYFIRGSWELVFEKLPAKLKNSIK